MHPAIGQTGQADFALFAGADGRRPEHVSTISFKVGARDSSAIVAAVDRHDLGIRYGDLHSRRLSERLELAGKGGVVRVSMVHYNTFGEVDRLVDPLDEAMR